LRKVLISITVVLLLSALCLSLVPHNVSSKTQDIKVLSYSHYIDALGILDIVGEIQNVGTSTIERAVLTAVVYGSDGSMQGSVTGYAWLSYMAPQQKSPFLLEIVKPIDEEYWQLTEISKVEISVKEAKETKSYLYSDFKITVSSAGVSPSGDDRGAYWVNGFVQNVGSQTATKLAVAAVFYNSSGCVVAIGRTDYLTDSITPSGTVMFKIGAFDTMQFNEHESRIIDSYALFAEAVSPLIDGNAPTVTAPVTGTSTGTQNAAISNSSNQSPNRIIIYIIIITAVAVVVVVFLLTSRKSTPSKAENINQKKPINKKRVLEKY